MSKTLLLSAATSASLLFAQTQIDLNKQVRNALPYASGGTGANSQTTARKNVGSPAVVATDFAGADLGAQVNAAFASFGAGRCGTVLIPEGVYTYTTTISVPTGCILRGMGRGQGDGVGEFIGTKLLYNGPPATVAIHLPSGNAYLSVSDLSIWTNATECPSNGMLKWNTAASGSNKWQCYAGSTFSAPLPHLAAILHGSIDPTVLADSTHIRVVNIDINGTGQNGDLNQQGAFHFGLWLNGCEECVIESVYAYAADDGFYFGPASNGVLVNQVTARVNRRSGIHVRSQNALLFNLPLMEANQWFGQPTQAGYGAGFLCDGEDSAGGLCRATMINAYFEANWLDVRVPDSTVPFEGSVGNFSHAEGYFNSAKLTSCVIPDASKITVSGSLFHGCSVLAGTFNTPSNQARVITTDPTGTLVLRVNKEVGLSERTDTYELVMYPSTQSFLYFRGFTNGEQVRLENPQNASAANNTESPSLRFRASKWVSGAPVEYTWQMAARASAIGGAPETTSGLYLSSNGTQMYSFRESGEFKVHKSDASATLLQSTGGPAYRFRLNNDSTLRLESTTNDFVAVRGTPLFVNAIDQVAIGQTSALHRLDVAGAIKMGDEGTKPACSATERGTLWHDFSGAGVKDTVEICAKDAADSYAWRVLY